VPNKHLETQPFWPVRVLQEQRDNSGNNSEISAAEQRDNSSANSDKKATISTRNILTP
jgi:hypothetical protein